MRAIARTLVLLECSTISFSAPRVLGLTDWIGLKGGLAESTTDVAGNVVSGVLTKQPMEKHEEHEVIVFTTR